MEFQLAISNPKRWCCESAAFNMPENLENSGATSLSLFTFTHWRRKWQSSVLAWRIPGTGKPAGLPSMGLHRVGNDWSDLAAAAAAAAVATGLEKVSFHSNPKEKQWQRMLKLLQNCTYLSSVQSLSHVRLFVTPWTAAHEASLSITNYQSLPKLMSIESVMPSLTH